jgi:hypothetical protein
MKLRLRKPTLTAATVAQEAARELAYRVSDGIHVFLFWHPGDDSVSLRVDDRKTGQQFDMPVKRHEAMFAFNHPFAYVS